jgi:hypothetical protein
MRCVCLCGAEKFATRDLQEKFPRLGLGWLTLAKMQPGGDAALALIRTLFSFLCPEYMQQKTRDKHAAKDRGQTRSYGQGTNIQLWTRDKHAAKDEGQARSKG